MEIQYYGANCVAITAKQARVVVDDNLSSLGLKSITKPDDIVVKTSKLIADRPARFTADVPGEYEMASISINGIAARGYMDKEDEMNSVIYVVSAGDLKVVIVGHISPDLNDDQLEKIGLVDIALIPVGNNGYTLDGTGALQIIKKIEPKVVIPTHYADKAVKYEVPQVELSESLKTMGMETDESLAKYKPKLTDLTDSIQLVTLERQ